MCYGCTHSKLCIPQVMMAAEPQKSTVLTQALVIQQELMTSCPLVNYQLFSNSQHMDYQTYYLSFHDSDVPPRLLCNHVEHKHLKSYFNSQISQMRNGNNL